MFCIRFFIWIDVSKKKLKTPSSKRERETLNKTLKKGKFPNVFFAIFFLSLNIFYTNNGASTKATTDISFSKILSDGPDVSLKGSPTVSPTTAAL